MEKSGPRVKLSVGKHPLKPRKGVAFRVKRRNTKPLFFRCSMEFEELFDFENPVERLCSIKPGYVELDGGVSKIMCSTRIWCEPRWTEACAKFVELRVHGGHLCARSFLILEDFIHGV